MASRIKYVEVVKFPLLAKTTHEAFRKAEMHVKEIHSGMLTLLKIESPNPMDRHHGNLRRERDFGKMIYWFKYDFSEKANRACVKALRTAY